MKLYLVNYRHKDSVPCKSITELPLEEAKKLAKQLYSGSSCRAHRRFGAEFERYYGDRRKAEQWMYDMFCELGGKPETKHPYYFTVQPSEALSENYGEYRMIQIDLDEIDDSDISFTLGDSMALYYTEKLHQVYTKTDLLEQLELYDNDVNKMLEHKKEQAAFIEAQLWNDMYLRND
ncbi:MAG: hypothetical protein E7268_04370 [Lachnospiraceae bacterium]|nr:hypothetical protein [Lachnospiraceae bacterium]